jgi:NodT family efflux transporter outer membrane factor (OMF) lipoprotein
MNRLDCLFIMVMSLTMSGCMVGPKYARPSAPAAPTDAYKELDGWKTAQPGDQLQRGPWWELFGDSQLNALEEELTKSNQDLKVAQDRFQQARAMIRFNRSALFPTISTAPTISGERESQNQPYFPIRTYNTGNYVLPFDLSYELDVWGSVRRAVAAAREEAQATAGDLATVSLSLHAELAYDYFELRSADSEQRLLDATVAAYTDLVQLTTDLFRGGAAPETDVVQAQTQLDDARVLETDIGVARAQYEHAIAILIGRPPAAFGLSPEPLSVGPPLIPVGVPSQLLERRPDIAASERRIAEANQQIGIARAAYFPTLILSATGGFEGNGITDWLTWPSRFWAVGPALAETLFDAGRRRATSEAARANYDATVATYRQTTLVAFQQVEDNLAALRILEREAQQEKEAVAESARSVELFTSLYKGGADPYLQVVTAQTIELSNELNALDIMRRRMDASVLLIKGLGGGWDTSKLPQIGSLH